MKHYDFIMFLVTWRGNKLYGIAYCAGSCIGIPAACFIRCR